MSPPDSQTGYKEIMDGYNIFRTYIVIVSLSDTANLGQLYIGLCMILGAILVVTLLSQNNKNTTVLSTFLVPYIRKSYISVVVANIKTTVSHNSNPLCT